MVVFSQSLKAVLEETAQEALSTAGLVYDDRTSLYYDWRTGFYYDPVSLQPIPGRIYCTIYQISTH